MNNMRYIFSSVITVLCLVLCQTVVLQDVKACTFLPSHANASDTSFLYTPDAAFQKVVREKLVEIYRSILQDNSLIGEHNSQIERRKNISKHLKSRVNEVEDYYKSVAVDGAKALDFAAAAEDLFYVDREIEWDQALVAVLNEVMQKEDLEDVYKIRPGYLSGIVSKNMAGESSSDFEYLGSDGEIHRLFDIEADYILLLFGSEGCKECTNFKGDLKRRFVKELIDEKKMAVLYITITQDLEFWKKKVKLPPQILSGFDIHHYITERTYEHSNGSGPLYYLSTYPVVYLIDGKTKEVVSKDMKCDMKDIIELLTK